MEQDYQEYCEQYDLDVDPSVLVSLSTSWPFVYASNDVSLLPLLYAVERHKDARSNIKYLRLVTPDDCKTKHCNPMAESNARVVRQLMEICTGLEVVDLTNVGLGSKGVIEIGLGIAKSESVTKVSLRRNPRGFQGFASENFISAVGDNKGSLQVLDVSSNSLEFETVCALRKVLPEGAELVDHGSHPFEEALNTLTHGVGFLLACIGSVVLLYNAYGSSRRVYYACCIYSFTLLFLYFSSTVYHSVYANKFWTDVLKILDHAAIYLLIAGSYTPYCMISFGDHPYGNLILFTEWACASLGILMIFITLRVRIPFADVIELALYIFMGWAISFVWDEANEKVGEEAIQLLMYGGMAYTGGILFYLVEKHDVHPIGHAIWHVFVVVGSAFHYFSILLHVVGMDESLNSSVQCDQVPTS